MEGAGLSVWKKIDAVKKFEHAAQHRDRDSELDEGHAVLHLKTPCLKELCSALSRGCVFEVHCLY